MPPKCKPAGPTTPNRLCTEVHAGQGGRSLSRRLRTHERAFQRAGIASGLVDSTGSAELRVNSGVAKMSLEKLVLAVIAAAVLIFLAITWQEARNDRVRLESTIDAQQRIIAAAVSSEKERETTLQTALAQIAAIKKSTQTPEQVLSALPEYLHLPEPITLSRSSPPASSQSGKGTLPYPNTSEFPTSLFTTVAEANSAPSPQSKPPRPQSSSVEATSGSETRQAPSPKDAGSTYSSSLEPGSQKDTPGPPRSQEASQNATPPPSKPNADLVASAQRQPPPKQSATIPAADLKPLFDYIQDCRSCQAQLSAAKADLADEQSREAALTRERDAAIRAAKGGTLYHRIKQNAKWLATGAVLAIAILRLH